MQVQPKDPSVLEKLIMLCTLSAVYTTDEPEKFRSGDFNCDEDIHLNDVLVIQVNVSPKQFIRYYAESYASLVSGYTQSFGSTDDSFAGKEFYDEVIAYAVKSNKVSITRTGNIILNFAMLEYTIYNDTSYDDDDYLQDDYNSQEDVYDTYITFDKHTWPLHMMTKRVVDNKCLISLTENCLVFPDKRVDLSRYGTPQNIQRYLSSHYVTDSAIHRVYGRAILTSETILAEMPKDNCLTKQEIELLVFFRRYPGLKRFIGTKLMLFST